MSRSGWKHQRRKQHTGGLPSLERSARMGSVRAHAQGRALRRYAFWVTEDQYAVWCDEIREGLARPIRPADKSGHIWAVTAPDGLELFAIWRDGFIRTFLTPEQAAGDEALDPDEAS